MWEQQEMGVGCCKAVVPSVEQVVLVGVSLCVCERGRRLVKVITVVCAKCESMSTRVCVGMVAAAVNVSHRMTSG